MRDHGAGLALAAVLAAVLAACTSTGTPATPSGTASVTGTTASSGSAGATGTTVPAPRATPSTGMPGRPSSVPAAPVPTPPPGVTRSSTPLTLTAAPARAPGIVSVLPTSAKVVALTFDGGADNRGAASILATLRSQGVAASFFVTGTFVAAYPDLVRELATIGPVGNHSWDHPHFPALTDAAVTSQLDRARTGVGSVTGRDPVPLFRFPFGDSDARTRALVGARGYRAVGWTVDSLGWQGTSGGQSVAAVVARVVAAARPGEIVLMHLGAHPEDNTTLDADALPQIIAQLRARGYGFVTLDSLS